MPRGRRRAAPGHGAPGQPQPGSELRDLPRPHEELPRLLHRLPRERGGRDVLAGQHGGRRRVAGPYRCARKAPRRDLREEHVDASRIGQRVQEERDLLLVPSGPGWGEPRQQHGGVPGVPCGRLRRQLRSGELPPDRQQREPCGGFLQRGERGLFERGLPLPYGDAGERVGADPGPDDLFDVPPGVGERVR